MNEREALRELVALKDMKDRGWSANDTDTEDEYFRRKPVAWAKARAALSQAEPALPVALSPQYYAIEHAGYLATAADHFMMVASDIAGAAEDGMDDRLRDRYSDAWKALRECVYEFRKRRDRAAHPVRVPE